MKTKTPFSYYDTAEIKDSTRLFFEPVIGNQWLTNMRMLSREEKLSICEMKVRLVDGVQPEEWGWADFEESVLSEISFALVVGDHYAFESIGPEMSFRFDPIIVSPRQRFYVQVQPSVEATDYKPTVRVYLSGFKE